jgi:hypothetical protein
MIAKGDTVHIIGKITQVAGYDPQKAVVIRVDKITRTSQKEQP